MNIVEREFVPVFLGNDINTYSMSRAFYEAYGVKSLVIGKVRSGPSCNSRIIDFHAVSELDKQEVFMETISGLAEKHCGKKIILMGCGDNYVELIIKNKAVLPASVIAPYVGEELMNRLLTKQEFYGMCDRYGLSYPATFIYDPSMGGDFRLPFGFPVIAKPSNGIKYWRHGFETQKKVYKLNNRRELECAIEEIYKSGYDDRLVIQNFVPGDDSRLRVMISYSGKDGRVKLMSLAHVLLEEHTPHGLGNTAVLVNEYNPELGEMLRNFLDGIGYTGYSTFDIKFDQRDGRFKVLEINLRQGRSNYYVTAAGNNLARYVVEDYIYNRELGFEMANARNLWTVIPLGVAARHIMSGEDIALMKRLAKEGKVVNPLFMKGDNKPGRMLFLYKLQASHYFKYRKYPGY